MTKKLDYYLNELKYQLSYISIALMIVTYLLIGIFHIIRDVPAGLIAGFMLPIPILLVSGYLIYARKLYAGASGLLIYTIMISSTIAILLENISVVGILINPVAAGYSIIVFKTLNLIYSGMALMLPTLVIIEMIRGSK